MISNTVRTRFAPSPTGYLHVGGARTALFNYLFSKKNEGKFILRIEDTDIERSTKESEDQLINTLKWLNLNWDEGPINGGNYGPYRQSERLEIYQRRAKELIEKGKAYEAYISPEEIEEIKNKLISEGKPPHYTYDLISKYNTKERIEEYNSKGLKPVVFLKMPQKDYELDDKIKGKVIFKKGSIGDFIILRSNGIPTYNFAVVVDDIDMKITHVIRGDDHLPNTLRQMAIYEAFEAETPIFAHVSMILGPDGKKLSKRHGATSVEEFMVQGYLPEAVDNYLALLGWSHPEGKEILPLCEIINNFTLDRVNSSPAIFDEKKLKWMNAQYLRNKPLEEIYQLAEPYVIGSKLLSKKQYEANKKWVIKSIETILSSVEILSEIPEKMEVFLKDVFPDTNDPEFREYFNKRGVKEAINLVYKYFSEDDRWDVQTITENLKNAMSETDPQKKPFYMSLRKILTDSFHGPDLINTIFLLGRNTVLERLQRVIKI
ncbi:MULTISPECIES: glutamate--tRNA ligase [Petrotoga]|uniref:Glutamate--tRNA ligase n=4 Tax=Petrotoga TaxID=28236 RepID=A0A4R8EZ44_9BACT|nr:MULTISPECIES: glutamate--tRNA ligase [Petrotoga]PNR98072.1 glutamyl-tRNA synthetase [Petrotoga olearia DSM 13574]POZ87885.1 glutamyl-tRNA synthetase [Petrotoga sibirica DSM 13575]POZ89933.1 glutamyl-tRNA synthetase [Petrotoga sp. SL27]RMA75667.1 glutamyl-tRNA synthetase [Petrotoga olearia]TDX16128.1 glutamyl-tRNA synthetase [Petrotoga sibirica]